METAFTTVQEKTSDELLAVCCKLLVNCELLYGIILPSIGACEKKISHEIIFKTGHKR